MHAVAPDLQPKLHSSTWTVQVHGVRVQEYNKPSEEIIRLIYEQNPKLRGMINIVRAHWRSKVHRLQRDRSALLLEIETTEQANYLIDESLVMDYELLSVEPFATDALVSRCFKCQLYGHVAFNCRNIAKCSICAGPAHPKDSPCAFLQHSQKHRCVACSGNHKSGHSSCPHLQQEKKRAHEAHLNRPRRFAIWKPTATLLPPATTSAPNKKRVLNDDLQSRPCLSLSDSSPLNFNFGGNSQDTAEAEPSSQPTSSSPPDHQPSVTSQAPATHETDAMQP